MGEGFFWYRLTWVEPDKGLLNGCVCAYTVSTYTVGVGVEFNAPLDTV